MGYFDRINNRKKIKFEKKLKKCPFCNCKPKIIEDVNQRIGIHYYYYIECKKCKIKIANQYTENTIYLGVRKWNKTRSEQ